MKSIALTLALTFLCGMYNNQPRHTDAQKKRVLTNSDSTYIYNVLHDSLSGIYCLSFAVKAPDYTGTVVISEFDLGYFFHKQAKNDLEYKKVMRQLLLNGDTLITSERIFKPAKDGGLKYGFQKVIPNAEVNKYAAEGEQAFIDHFYIWENGRGQFNQERVKGLKEKDAHALINAIVSQLFEWRYYVGRGFVYKDAKFVERLLEKERLRRKVREKGTARFEILPDSSIRIIE